MGTAPSIQGIAYVHVGTHKTGTTSIQALLAMNDAAFREAGLFVPQTGRIAPGFAAHHNIAWELTHDTRFRASLGTFHELLTEIDRAKSPAVCLSSEDFEFLQVDKGALCRLRDGLLDAGYRPRIIVYMRPQADYFESLYAEVVKEWDIGYDEYFESMVSGGYCGVPMLDYDRLTDAFAEVFGPEHLVVQAYRASAASTTLLEGFVKITAERLNFRNLLLPERLNRMAPFVDVISARERLLGCNARHSIEPRQPFDPLDFFDILRLIVRFARCNEHIARGYGARIGCVTTATFVRELITAVFNDRASRHRKRLIRALVQGEIENVA